MRRDPSLSAVRRCEAVDMHARVGNSLWELSAILLLFVLDVLCVLVEEVPVSQNGQHCFMVVADTLSWPHWALT